MLHVDQIEKSYAQGDRKIPVLRGASLSADKGRKIAIIGQSGSGKSTLLGLLAGLDRPDSGDIRLDEVSFASLSEHEITQLRGRKIGIIFQQFHLLPSLTALENAALPLELQNDPDASNKSAEALRKVGLQDRLGHFPHQLSGGEMQRVAITRSILHGPKLLLADEPTGNLDQKTGHEVMDILLRRADEEDLTLLIVTHNHDLAGACDERYLLKEGQLQKEDT